MNATEADITFLNKVAPRAAETGRGDDPDAVRVARYLNGAQDVTLRDAMRSAGLFFGRAAGVHA